MSVWESATTAVTVASGVLIGMHWFRRVLEIWLPPTSRVFWVYDRLARTVEVVSLSRGAFGRGGSLAVAAGAAPIDPALEERKAEAARI